MTLSPGDLSCRLVGSLPHNLGPYSIASNLSRPIGLLQLGRKISPSPAGASSEPDRPALNDTLLLLDQLFKSGWPIALILSPGLLPEEFHDLIKQADLRSGQGYCRDLNDYCRWLVLVDEIVDAKPGGSFVEGMVPAKRVSPAEFSGFSRDVNSDRVPGFEDHLDQVMFVSASQCLGAKKPSADQYLLRIIGRLMGLNKYDQNKIKSGIGRELYGDLYSTFLLHAAFSNNLPERF
jgi:hypothetical protein